MNKIQILNKKPEDALLINKKKEAPENKATATTTSPVIEENSGINLIPNLSKEEIVKESKKKTLNMGAVISLMALVVISILVVGFNIISKIQLNSEKKKLYNYEQRLNALSNKITSNNEIRERVFLYKNIQKDVFSSRSVIEYINGIASKSGNIKLKTFDFGGQLSFDIEGEAYSYEDVSKFWYLLLNDRKIESISLKSVGKTDKGVRFNFQGKLVFSNFVSNV